MLHCMQETSEVELPCKQLKDSERQIIAQMKRETSAEPEERQLQYPC